jgi:hypothetical protein
MKKPKLISNLSLNLNYIIHIHLKIKIVEYFIKAFETFVSSILFDVTRYLLLSDQSLIS